MSLLSSVTDAIGLTDTGAGAEAAYEAGQVTKAQTEKAMQTLEDQYHRGRKKLRYGGNQALRSLLTGRTQAHKSLEGGFQGAMGRLDPLSTMGMDALNAYQYGSTAEGFGSNLEDLLMGGSLDPLVASNQRELEAQLSAQGLGRSGYGVTEMSQIPIEVAMGIESELQNRRGNVMGSTLPAIYEQSALESGYGGDLASLYGNTATMGADMMYGQAQDLTNLHTGYGSSAANAQMGLGSDLSSAILAGQQSEAAERAALMNMMGGAAGSMAPV